MNIADPHTPVLVLNCKLGGLAIMRSLGKLGVPLYGVDGDPGAPGLKSRYCRKRFVKSYDADREKDYLDYILDIARNIDQRMVLIPTSDELSLFVAKNHEILSRQFIFWKNAPKLIADLISKEGMFELASRYQVPTPYSVFPKTLSDVLEYSENVTFPVMLKGIFGNLLQEKTGLKMVIVRTREELLEMYKRLEDPEHPNLILQEYIPGDDTQIYIFNGYFDENSECQSAFTGHKLRQFPVHIGCASLGICKWNQEVADITTRFMKSIGYKGVLDIGYRLDHRDGLYKVLDINPRVGQAFRLFVAENGMDAVRSAYLDLTGQNQVQPIVPREGRRWVIEDCDLISSYHYHKEGVLGFSEWLRSFKDVEECAWFDWKDPLPFLWMLGNLTKKALVWTMKRIGIVKDIKGGIQLTVRKSGPFLDVGPRESEVTSTERIHS